MQQRLYFISRGCIAETEGYIGVLWDKGEGETLVYIALNGAFIEVKRGVSIGQKMWDRERNKYTSRFDVELTPWIYKKKKKNVRPRDIDWRRREFCFSFAVYWRLVVNFILLFIQFCMYVIYVCLLIFFGFLFLFSFLFNSYYLHKYHWLKFQIHIVIDVMNFSSFNFSIEPRFFFLSLPYRIICYYFFLFSSDDNEQHFVNFHKLKLKYSLHLWNKIVRN